MPHIDEDVFKQCMGMLGDRFGRALKTPTIRVYYELLNEELDSEELALACRQVIRSAKYFPSPLELIDAARPSGDSTLDALAALRLIQRSQSPVQSDPLAFEAMELAGAWGDWSDRSSYANVQREKLFVDTYVRLRLERERKTLVAPVSRPQLVAGDEP